MGGVCGGIGVGLGGQSGCERRIEVFVKIQKKKIFFWGGGWGGGWSVVGGGSERGQGGCERRIEHFFWGGSGVSGRGRVGLGGVRVDVNEEFKVL